MWYYRASLDRVIDGDTAILMVDLGFECYQRVALRFKDVWAPELEDPGGLICKQQLEHLLDGHKLIIRSEKPDGQLRRSFARYVADVYRETDPGDVSVNQLMRNFINNGEDNW